MIRLQPPIAFTDYVPQPATRQLWDLAVRRGVSGVFLFLGPPGTGKTTTARTLGLARRCLEIQETGDICGTCAICAPVFQTGAFPYELFHSVHPKDVNGPAEVYDWIHHSENISVLLFDEVHGHTSDVHDALLERLDIPPDDALIILATTDASKIPLALKSRCDVFDFSLLPDDDMATMLVRVAGNSGITISRDGALLIARHAGGQARDAVRVVERLARSMDRASMTISDDAIQRLVGTSDQKLMADLLSSIAQGNPVNRPLFHRLWSRRAMDFPDLADRVIADAILSRDYAAEAGLNPSPGFWVVARNVSSAEFGSYRSLDHLFAYLSVTADEAARHTR